MTSSMRFSGILYIIEVFLMTIIVFAMNSSAENTNKSSIDTTGIYELGLITVYGHPGISADELGSCVDKETIEKKNIKNIADAVSTLPGVTLTKVGGRNESQVFIHGFNSQQIGLFIDGIPIYVPYDGNVDLARFSTFDVGQLTIEKGLSSILYGPNAMGGVINITSRKPISPLDIRANSGYRNTGFVNDFNLGSNIGKWYGILSMSYSDQEDYTLSKDYSPTLKNVQMGSVDGDNRNNSYHRDSKVSAKLGYNPQPGDEISITALMQHGVKGVPPYSGDDTASSKYRFWRWPNWDKYSAYLIGRWQFGRFGYVKLPVYYDNFQNSLDAYDDSSYSTMKKKSSFTSNYNDYSAGGSLEYGTGVFTNPFVKDSIRINMQYKNDYHWETNTTNDTSKSPSKQVFIQKPDIHFRDQTFCFGFENALHIREKLTIVPGAGYNVRQTLTAENLIDTTKVFKYSVGQFEKPQMDAFDGQIAVYYKPADKQTVSASVARRTRFPNIKDRYSYRLGMAIPNPDLKPEYAIHYQLTYSANPIEGLNGQFSLFESQVYDCIQTVTNVGPKSESQLQNTGRARYAGYEYDSTANWALPAPEVSLSYSLPVNCNLVHSVSAWINGSYITRRNLTNPSILFVDEPVTQVRGGVEYNPVKNVGFTFDIQHESERISSSDGKWRTTPFTLYNCSISMSAAWFTLHAGCANLTDENYSLSEGYPEEGRTFYANLSFNLNKGNDNE